MAWNIGEKKMDTKKATTGKVAELRPLGKDGSGMGTEELRATGEFSGKKDLAGGMEILEQDFRLSVIENTAGNDSNDVAMRRLSFNELLRRDELMAIDSNALKVYAVNNGNLYGKTIQCEAMKKLTERTVRKSNPSD